MTAPRGLRNANPGNIRYSANSAQFVGCIGSDGAFCIFDTPEHGIRAVGVILQTYKRKYKIASIRATIKRWAPPSENDTEAYIRAVSARMGIGDTAVIDLAQPRILAGLVRAIIRQENGQQPYTDTQLNAGLAMALGITPTLFAQAVNGKGVA